MYHVQVDWGFEEPNVFSYLSTVVEEGFERQMFFGYLRYCSGNRAQQLKDYTTIYEFFKGVI